MGISALKGREEVKLDHPIFREPFRALPEVEIVWEQTSDQLAGPKQMIVWVRCDDFEAFEAAVDADPGTKRPEVLSATEDRRLYCVDLTERGQETNLSLKTNEVGGLLQRAIGTCDGWRCRVQLPDREAAEEIYRFYRTQDIDWTFHSLYERTDWIGSDGPKLTEPQQEILIEAVECGFLEIPRETALADLAERLGISETAASERFRRAVKNLTQQTIQSLSSSFEERGVLSCRTS
ncbi:MAG: helix-turn-helix domain-containing protein [Halobacteriales archaeon]|nr:helix-turn-helix domain-containing protein [Halobacteriales archaeon]